MQNEAIEQVDVVVIGAGLSGIGSAWHLMHRCPDRSFVILESRHAIGGTWDLFRYPGIRSDSDMHTLGYVFKPWTEARAIADGPSILRYVNETADEHGIHEHVRFGHRVRSADWSSNDATLERGGGTRRQGAANRVQDAAAVRRLLQLREPEPADLERRS